MQLTMKTKLVSRHNRQFYSFACLVARPLNESEAGGDLVLMETFLLFLC